MVGFFIRSFFILYVSFVGLFLYERSPLTKFVIPQTILDEMILDLNNIEEVAATAFAPILSLQGQSSGVSMHDKHTYIHIYLYGCVWGLQLLLSRQFRVFRVISTSEYARYIHVYTHWSDWLCVGAAATTFAPILSLQSEASRVSVHDTYIRICWSVYIYLSCQSKSAVSMHDIYTDIYMNMRNDLYVCMCVWVCVSVRMNVCMFACVYGICMYVGCMYKCVYMYAHIYRSQYARYTYRYMYIYIYIIIYLYVCVCVCMYLRVYVRVCL